MSWTLLERARSLHEDIERYERGIMGILNDKTKTNRDRVWQQHHVKNCITRINDCANDLKKFYLDGDGIFKEENETMKGRNVMSSFYENLKEIKEHHTRFPNTIVNHEPPIELEKEVKVQFSGEEVFGKYFDLHFFHEQFNNLGNFERIEYGAFLNQILNLSRLNESKKNQTYYKFLSELFNYFQDFFRRTQPLIEFDELAKECLAEFEDKWDKNIIDGWSNPNHSMSNSQHPLNLDQFNSEQDLEALGGERLKEALSAIGLKCGGTTKERAERLFSVKGLSSDQIPQKLKVVDSKKRSRNEFEEERKKKMAEIEYRIVFWVDHMQDIYQNTIRLIDKKMTRTVEEREAEIREEEEGALPDLDDEEEEESDNEVIYNPLNLPLGWDGKPIPFWLYKLYGLGVEYKCEICGNYSYWGRRTFDRHFQEWRHAYGMRRLGIPNTKHFHDITVIDDALTLYAKIKDQINAEIYHPDQEEEYEDIHGNVMPRGYANGSYSY